MIMLNRRPANFKSLYQLILNTILSFSRVWNEKLGLRRAKQFYQKMVISLGRFGAETEHSNDDHFADMIYDDNIKPDNIGHRINK